jgi:hypothetical protein
MDWKAKWGIAAVCASILAGVIVLPAAAPENRDGLCPVWAQDVKKVGYIDKTGREVVPPQFDRTRRFFEGLAAVERNGKYGYIDKTGREVIPLQFDDVYFFSEGLAEVERNGKWGFIDKTGREVVPPQFDRTRRFFEGLAWVTRNGKEGYIDKTGREVLPIRYESASHCANGLYVVSDAKKDAFYLLDANGKRIAEFDRQEEVRTRTITSPSGH